MNTKKNSIYTPRNSANSQVDKIKESHMWTHHGPTDENQVQGILKRVSTGSHVTHEVSSQLASIKTNEARRQGGDILQGPKERSCHMRILYQAKLTFRKGEIKTLQDKQNRSEFIASRPSL